MSKVARVSVIIPVYNVAKLLERCVSSVLAQSYSNLEVILVDDGSTDMSGQFCDIFEKRDPRVKVIHQENAGLSAARNAGLKLATGRFITFVDSDDEIAPDLIDHLLHLCLKYDTKMSICGFSEIRETVHGQSSKQEISGQDTSRQVPDQGQDSSQQKPIQGQPECDSIIAQHKHFVNGGNNEVCLSTLETISRMLLEDGFSMSAWGKLYARELFADVNFPEGKLYEDVGTTYRLVLQCSRIAISDAQKYHYHLRSDSITRQDFSLRKLDLIELTDKMCDELLAWGRAEELSAEDRTYLENLTHKRRMHARFSILRQMVLVPGKGAFQDTPAAAENYRSFKTAERAVVKYLRRRRAWVLNNPLATRRDHLAMQSLRLGLPVFRFAWKKYQKHRE